MGSYRSLLIGMYTSDPKTLSDFDITPRKKAPKPKTAKQLVAVQKAEATRKARHTMGKVQKKSVKGTVELTQEQLQDLTSGSQPTAGPAPGPVGNPPPTPAPAAAGTPAVAQAPAGASATAAQPTSLPA